VAEETGGPGLVPILVDGSGRDGTTLAMQLLATSPEIAFDRNYPYEQRYFSYLLQWARLPEDERWEAVDWGLDHLAHAETLRDASLSGPIPWVERSLIAGPQPLWKQLFETAWTEFSSRARAAVQSQLGDSTLQVRYYAQKNAESWALGIDEIPPPRPRLLCLLRDPRDVWQSSIAFHQRRQAEGNSFLPIGEDESVETYLTKFIGDQKHRLGWLRKCSREAETPIVRYERLVTDLPEEAERLGDWLGLRLDGEAVLRRRNEFGKHITAASPEQSVGRWKDEMPEDLIARFSQAIGPDLAEFGYEV
jgi:hypothetical protein